MSATELFDLGTALMEAVVTAFDDADVDLPARRYVTAGQPADDCEQVVVWLGRVFTGLPGNELNEPEKCGVPRSLEVNVRITRCVAGVHDDGSEPSVAQIEATAARVATDLWVLPRGLLRLYAAGEFLELCTDLVIGNCIAFEWSGYAGGVELLLRIQISDLL